MWHLTLCDISLVSQIRTNVEYFFNQGSANKVNRYLVLGDWNGKAALSNKEDLYTSENDLIKSAKSINFCKDKVETLMGKLTDAIAENDPEMVQKIVDKDFELLKQAENCLFDLEQLLEGNQFRSCS